MGLSPVVRPLETPLRVGSSIKQFVSEGTLRAVRCIADCRSDRAVDVRIGKPKDEAESNGS